MDLEYKMKKLNEYSVDEFSAYQDGYRDGQKTGVNMGLMAIKDLLIENYHELPTTLGYTEQLIDLCIQTIMEKYHSNVM